MVAYDNAAGSENLKTVFGVGYVALVAVFAVRLLRRRAAYAKSEVRRAVQCVRQTAGVAVREQRAAIASCPHTMAARAVARCRPTQLLEPFWLCPGILLAAAASQEM